MKNHIITIGFNADTERLSGDVQVALRLALLGEVVTVMNARQEGISELEIKISAYKEGVDKDK